MLTPAELQASIARLWHEGGFLRRIAEAGPELERVRVFAERFAGLREVVYNDPRQRPYWFPPFPGIRATPWHTPDDYPWAAGLRAALSEIQSELSRVLSQNLTFIPYMRNASGAAWSLFPLQYMGVPADQFATVCPLTMARVHALPDNARDHVFGDLAFSCLEPGHHLVKHYSADSLRIRCHMGLVVDNSGDQPWLRVTDETRHWEVGELLAFDDGFDHEAANPSTSARFVLIADFWHPDLTPVERRALVAAFSPVSVRATVATTRAARVDDAMLRAYAATDTRERRAGLWDA
ncbi:MAG: aspartyl/asparaginyl beta-hydroxylase domain-containing protein [Proteobacteria bacterium]|nr:aspartyl/asparaginyl beta-hydroxylase domain-containing protein [Pseudomonadota bacterium]